ncbi:MAG: hypothetical protein JSS53_06700 [Proteobacteria bacterium]|nr:hypothetical protein [Pseudomonadota bacterium]
MSKILEHRDDVSQLCKELFENAPITYFEYARYYFDGTFFEINTNASITKAYLENDSYPSLKEFAVNKSKFVCFSRDIELPYPAKAATGKYLENISIFESFDIKHRIYIDQAGEDYFDCCGFGTNLSFPNTMVYYLNNLDFLDLFRKNFLKQNQKILQNMHNNRIQLFTGDDIADPNIIKANEIIQSQKFTLEKFNVSIQKVLPKTNFSAKEFLCIQHSAHGKTAKETGQALGVSYRTIEKHWQNIREKTGVNQKSGVIDLYWWLFDSKK